ncbi:MAG TPA: glycosyltransferase family 2 protein [Chthoniobacteraceae bacterium]|nr:glycosyltransferase family 2 protein [Chthoniobacteraceae bacterium]
MSRCIAAVIATYRRPSELARLLASLQGVDAVVVCNNGADSAVRAVCESAPVSTTCLDSKENIGCGGGLRLAEEDVWRRFRDQLSHLLVLDDDAQLEADTVIQLADVMESEHAAVVYPLVAGPGGRVGWTPGLKDRAKHRLGAESLSVADYRERFRAPFAEFDWAQGICLLVRREAMDAAGFHRGDFWVRGEDLDFSLRLTACGRGIFAPGILVKHLPPNNSATSSPRAEFLRHAAMIQNIAYLTCRQPHGRRIALSLPGASRRFLSTWGIDAAPDLARALWRGVVRAEAAGQGDGRTFFQRFKEVAKE